MAGGKKCAFNSCPSSTKNKSPLRFFKFPVNNQKVCDSWVINCANNQLFGLAKSALRSRVVCERHFDPLCFNSPMRSSKLRSDAVPTLFCLENEQHELSSGPVNNPITTAASSDSGCDDLQPQSAISIQAETSHAPSSSPSLQHQSPATLSPPPPSSPLSPPNTKMMNVQSTQTLHTPTTGTEVADESGATKRAEATSSKPKNQIVSAIKEEDVKEELILEDYGDPDEAMELQSVVGVQGTEDIRDAGVAFARSFLPSGMEGSFETIICGSTDVKIKQEIFEDESDSFRSSHTAEITPISPPSMTFTESTELLSTVIPPAVLKTSSDSLKCLSKMTATPGYSAATKPTINVANMPGQPPHQWIRGDLNSGQNCACEICNAISRKIPVNSRKAARDKILELISFISDGSVNPALVNFSVMSK